MIKNKIVKTDREKEIELFIKKLKEFWLLNKEQRFGQLLVNILNKELKDYDTSLLFYMTDAHILANIVDLLFSKEKK